MNFPSSTITDLFKIKYPIIQAGMIWVSGAKLASASANAGCLGILGAGSMKPDLLREQIKSAIRDTDRPLAVNIPLLYELAPEQIQVALDEGIKIFFTSAGSPKKFTTKLKDQGCTVVHVTSSPELALKCQDAGVDAVVAEGFEAGGHNGRDELTTMVLIPQVVDAVSIPVIAAGGIGDGRTMAAALALGASAVQMGTRFMMTGESSAHKNYKDLLVSTKSNSTQLSLKELVPVRLIKNHFFQLINKAEEAGASKEELIKILSKGRAKMGMFEGDLSEGELEAGQICGLINDLPSVADMVKGLLAEYQQTLSLFK
ncbi:MAG: nitronate monooxygenase [Halobacteriovoraceae bacterium]|jgi:enoyl-[acyl-carrier protein] reductase II|nr:nitronate monooxygenase [Halobacteriovoraceae bacterium]MBT5093637.1 nitronate monooxygenase [Halobacteriovoraceae bacterium]